jgi:hypothetical protein
MCLNQILLILLVSLFLKVKKYARASFPYEALLVTL